MLYVTTRVEHDAFTAFRPLSENRGPEGGFFVPVRMPYLDEKQISYMAEKSFSQNIAEILNMFFGVQMDGRNLELGIGRYPVKLLSLSGKVIVANTWHNPVYRFERLVSGVEKVIRQSDAINKTPSDWLMIAARIAVLVGVYGLLLQNGTLKKRQTVDIAVPSGNLSALMAAWYAKSMGLPVGVIVCSCNENNSLWSLFHKGELRTDAVAIRTRTPDCDFTMPNDLERLIFATLGREETYRFCETFRSGGLYFLEEEKLLKLRGGIHVSVVGERRVASTIPNLYKTTGLIADPYTALAYSGLVDYRAATGASNHALIVSEESPLFSLQFIAECMNIPPAELKSMIN